MNLDALSHLTYLTMETCIIGGTAFIEWAFHFKFLWARRWHILLGVVLFTFYALPLDAYAVSQHWGWFNPRYVSGIYFFGGSLLLEEIVFWLGTSFVTISAVMIFAEGEERRYPRWLLPAAVILPFELLDDLIKSSTPPARKNPTTR